MYKIFTHIEGTKIEKNVVVGPYARLRPGTILEEGSKIGNFVETKKSKIGKFKSKSPFIYWRCRNWKKFKYRSRNNYL